MENIEKCECCIGIINDYNNTRMVTLAELKEHIKDRLELRDYNRKMLLTKEYNHHFKYWYLEEYCDKRKSTDLTRFNYCPLCGKKIDWKSIKGGSNG